MAETTFDLQFDIVVVHNSFHPILAHKFFQVTELLLTTIENNDGLMFVGACGWAQHGSASDFPIV